MHFFKRTFCLILVLSLLGGLCAFALDAPDPPDIAGHWAEATLRQGIRDGLLYGYEDGTMRPDEPIPLVHVLVLMVRVLGAQPAGNPADYGLSGEEWYASSVLAAASLGLVEDTARLNQVIPRGEALSLLCRALGLTQETPDRSVLEPFIEKDAPDEILFLVARGLVVGYGGSLHLDKPLTRAEFFSILYRTLGELDAVHRGETEIENKNYSSTLWLAADTQNLCLRAVTAPEVSLNAPALETLRLEDGTEIGRLVLGCGGNAALSLSGGSRIAELCIEGDGLTLHISGGTVEKLVINGADFVLLGDGIITETVLNTVHSEPPENAGLLTDRRDFGIAGGEIESVTAPELLPLQALLEAEASALLPESAAGKTAEASWYLGADCLETASVVLTGGAQRFTYSGKLSYSRGMPGSAEMEFRLHYTGKEVSQTLTARSAPIEIENHTEDWYDAREAERVLALVDTGYAGDYTLAWAQANDYLPEDKVTWVNAKGFSSDTEYLIWVSLKYQRCNVFRGEQGNWELVRSGIIASGKLPYNFTPTGVWKVTYKQPVWYFATYIVRPIVRFKGGGYAFHSRPVGYDGTTLVEPQIGYPTSHGCIRMYDEDIQFLYDYVPENTTVVVF